VHLYYQNKSCDTKRKNLKHVESFKLDVATFLFQHVHHQFEIVSTADVARHDRKVVTVQQQLT